MLGGVRIVALSINFMNRLNKTESSVCLFLNCRFSLFLNDLFFQINLVWHINDQGNNHLSLSDRFVVFP